MRIYAQKVLVTIAILFGVSILAISLYFIFPHFIPFIVAFLFALMLESANDWLTKRTKLKRIFAVNITYFLFLGSILILSYFIITKITLEMVALIKNIQKNIPLIQDWLTNAYHQSIDIISMAPKEVSDQIYDWFNNILKNIQTSDLLSNVGGKTYDFTTAIPNFFIILIIIFVSIYLFSLNLPLIKNKFYSYFTNESTKKVQLILSDLRKATIGFIQAQLILSTITYFISLIGLLIIDMRYALAIALLIVFVDLLPILGTGSTLVPWAIISFTFGRIFEGIGLIILFIVLTVVRRIIEPKILGERIGLNSLTTLITIWIGFKILGIIGVFLGPLLLILYNALVKAEIIKFKFKL